MWLKVWKTLHLIIVFVSHRHYDLRSSFVKSHTTLKPADFIKEQEGRLFQKVLHRNLQINGLREQLRTLNYVKGLSKVCFVDAFVYSLTRLAHSFAWLNFVFVPFEPFMSSCWRDCHEC
jgi:hypothetical protein